MPPPYTMNDFKNAAAYFFSATTGQSPRVCGYYSSLQPEVLNQPITPDAIGHFVAGENHAVLYGTSPLTAQDRLAIAATPLRGVAAHFVAQQMVLARSGYLSSNPYAQEAFLYLSSGTFG